MSTSYGKVTVQFPGFRPIELATIDGSVAVFGWDGSRRPCTGRSLTFVGEKTPQRLSRKERSRFLTHLKRWNKRRGYRVLAKESLW